MKKQVRVLDSTLRDGSYEIEFQFTPEDTALLVSGLDKAGVSYIEIGHGMGLGRDLWTAPAKVRSAAPDEAHLEAARSVLNKSVLGALLIVGPGYAPLSVLELLPKYGIKLARIAIRPQDIQDPNILKFLDRSKELDLIVSLNVIETNVLTPKQAAKAAIEAKRRGTDWFYVVDSAGCMTPPETQEYVRSILDAGGLEVGMHTHNNRGLAMANSLAAIEAGATLVDGTLQGMGRATGNAPTEQLLFVLQELGIETGVDAFAVARLADLVRALFAEKGNSPTHFVSGVVKQHSRQLAQIVAASEKKGLSLREYIFHFGKEVQKRNLLGREFGESLLDEVAQAMPKVSVPKPSTQLVQELAKGVLRKSSVDPTEICGDLFSRFYKKRKLSVLCLMNKEIYPFKGPLIFENGDCVGTAVAYSSEINWANVPKDRRPEYLLVDSKLNLADTLKDFSKNVISVSFKNWLQEATIELISALLAKNQRVVWVPDVQAPELLGLVDRLREMGVSVNSGIEMPSGERIVLTAMGDSSRLKDLGAADLIVTLAHAESAIHLADVMQSKGIPVLRPALDALLSSKSVSLIQMVVRVENPNQRVKVGGTTAVNCLVVPASAEVVVDSLSLPSQVADWGGLASTGVPVVSVAIADQRAQGLLAGKGSL